MVCPHCKVRIGHIRVEGIIKGELHSGESVPTENHREWMLFTCPACNEDLLQSGYNARDVMLMCGGTDKA